MKAEDALNALKEGNERFVNCAPLPRAYPSEALAELARGQSPFAAVVACSDSRVCPELVFDLPLGAIFVSRVPANVASDSAKWMIDIAVGEFRVPLVVVMAHSGCLAVKQVVEGKEGAGGMLRYRVQSAYHEASRNGTPDDVYERTINENAKKTCLDLAQESSALGDAIRSGQTSIRAARFDIETGQVAWL